MTAAPVRQAPDLRLALGAAAAWIALALCLARDVRTVVAVAVAGAAVGVAALLIARRYRRVRVLHALGAAAFCIAVVLVPFAGRLWQARASPLTQLARGHAEVAGVLTTTGDPHLLAAKGVAGAPRMSITTDADEIDSGGRRWSDLGAVLVLGPATPWRAVLPGQQVRVDGSLQPALDNGAAGAVLFTAKPPERIGTPPWWQRAAGRVREGLREAAAVLPTEERGLLPGLVDGDTAGLDPVLIERFRVAGLTHLVAVSGTNCSIVIGAVLLVLRRARVRPWICGVVGAAVLVAFVVVARPSPSVLRAALMAAIALVSLATGRPRQAVPALAGVVLALLIWQPQLATDAGFTMSVLATAALLLIAPGWAQRLRSWRVPPGLAEAVAVAAAAHLVTAPVIALISGRLSLVAIPANVLAEPAVPVATVLGFAAAVIAPLWLPGAQGLAWLAGWPCRWLTGVADRMGALPGASLPWGGGVAGALALAAVGALLVIFARRAGIGRALAAAVLLAVVVQIPVRTFAAHWPPSGWLFVACDVGQGDALVLSAAPHVAVEVDAGPDPVAVDRCLRDLGISDVALLVFTHYHLDHVGGFAGVLHHRHVSRVVTGPLAEPASGVELVRSLLAQHQLTISTPGVGTQYTIGQVHLDVLGPAAAFHGTRSDPNNSSLVLAATVGDVRILLPGDAEIEAQQALLAAGVDLRADVLKVPHHGSAYSDPSFLAAVHARLAVISVGLHNDYGHPSPLLLADLSRLGLPVRRTDQDGDVAVVGTRAHLTSVIRGTAASEPLGRVAEGPALATSASTPGARMGTWPAPAQLLSRCSTSCPNRCRRSCSSWGMKSCLSPAPSARSPPRCVGTSRT